jgi:hypothetical protein
VNARTGDGQPTGLSVIILVLCFTTPVTAGPIEDAGEAAARVTT